MRDRSTEMDRALQASLHSASIFVHQPHAGMGHASAICKKRRSAMLIQQAQFERSEPLGFYKWVGARLNDLARFRNSSRPIRSFVACSGRSLPCCRQLLTASTAKTEFTNVVPHNQCHGIEGDARASAAMAGWFSAGTGDTLLVGGLIRSDVYLLLGS